MVPEAIPDRELVEGSADVYSLILMKILDYAKCPVLRKDSKCALSARLKGAMTISLKL